jgi:hypothetical protein
MKKYKKSIIFNILFILIFIIVCLLLAEIFSRIYLYVSGKGGYIHLPDDYLGRVHASNSNFVFEEDFSREFKVRRRTNSLGLIGEEVAVKKPQNVFRILVLGDSFTEALQVEEGRNFCERLQYLLNKQSPNSKYSHYEVLNAGISGYSPISEYLYFKKELFRLEPDLVILQLFPNDVFEDNKVSAMSIIDEDGLPLKINRFFIKDLNNSLPNEFWYKFKKYLLKKSKFFQVIVRAKRKFYKRSYTHREKTKLPEFNDSNQFFIIQDYNPLFQDKDFRIRTWQATKRYILAIRQLAKENNAKFFIVLIPVEFQLNREEDVKIDSVSFSSSNLYFNNLLKDLCSRENIYFLDLLTTFKKNKDKELYYYKDGHLKDQGHKIVAETLFLFISRYNLIY